ncbi:hypothetical protein BSPWISOXPB_8883 [uncultured Gammaproteobacteria bacterium]|nr:hypothetical protein BSPWISOXPB_8883 [uncultured Gammaproteobacteria bacterium]
MINFHLRRNLLVAVFIIVPIGVVWLFITLVSSIFISDDNMNLGEATNYIEKIDNFVLQEFNNKQQLVYLIEAKNYFNFKQAPALLIEPMVTTYNEKGGEFYTMTSKRAHYLGNGEIKFKGKVDIKSNTGAVYKMQAKELLINTKTSDLSSRKEITYFDEHSKVFAQGMTMIDIKDKMQLWGKISISQNGGQEILTRDLTIDQSNAQKHYYSKNDTTYIANGNKIYAQGIDMNKNLVKLLNTVKIVQKSGSKINTKNLMIDQSNDKEIYSTKEKVHYQSKAVDIYSTGMHFNAKAKKVKLTGGVIGHYE